MKSNGECGWLVDITSSLSNRDAYAALRTGFESASDARASIEGCSLVIVATRTVNDIPVADQVELDLCLVLHL